jgi:catechol 2,3-dioxygenase-like lactoylglutathione lyase family enzyme
MSIPAVRLNHAVLYVSDLQRAVRFYTEAFGMNLTATEPRADAAFLRLPLRHQGPLRRGPGRQRVRGDVHAAAQGMGSVGERSARRSAEPVRGGPSLGRGRHGW